MKLENSLVKIYGGFGNQLFQYCFANYLKRLQKEVYINNFWFSSVKDKFGRNEIFEPEFFGFKRASKPLLKMFEIADRYSDVNGSLIYSKFDDKNYELSSNKFFNYYTGIWQNSKYLDNSQEFLISTLTKNEEISDYYNCSPRKKSVMLHVRGDNYIGEEIDFRYFYKCIDYIKNEIGKDIFINLFTDNKDVLKENRLINLVDEVNLPDNNKDDTLSNFAKMLNHEHFIISNSTYSYMAALMKSGNKNITLMPKPWMISKENKFLHLPQFTEVSRV